MTRQRWLRNGFEGEAIGLLQTRGWTQREVVGGEVGCVPQGADGGTLLFGWMWSMMPSSQHGALEAL